MDDPKYPGFHNYVHLSKVALARSEVLRAELELALQDSRDTLTGSQALRAQSALSLQRRAALPEKCLDGTEPDEDPAETMAP